jgi:hypothetical protein
MERQFLVRPCNHYDENQLVPFPDRESRDKLLLFESLHDSRIIYSINVRAGGLIIGLNAMKRISSIELAIYRRNWRVLTDGIPRPTRMVQQCVEFSSVQAKTNNFDDLRLAVFTDPPQSTVKIEIGDDDRTRSSWVAISKCCVAEIADSSLIGFLLDISDY